MFAAMTVVGDGGVLPLRVVTLERGTERGIVREVTQIDADVAERQTLRS